MKKPLIPYGWLRALVFLFVFLLSIFIVTAIVIGGMFLSKLLEGGASLGFNDVKTILSQTLWMTAIFNTLTAFLSVWLSRKFIDRQSFLSLGFAWKGFETHAWTGFWGAIAMLGGGTIVLILLKYITFTDVNFDALSLLSGAGMMLLVAVSEELVVRGYILNNLMQSMNKWVALPVSAVLFAAMHLGNPGMGILSFVEIFIAGFMLGLNYIYTKNLWFGIALHFAWNFVQGPVLGYEVSGLNLPSLLHLSLNGPEAMTGGAFGFEGSVLSMVMNLAFMGILVWAYEKKAMGWTTDDRPQTTG